MRPISLNRCLFILTCIIIAALPVFASDHVDSPNNAEDRGTDLADGYMFLDPNDNSRVVMIMTWSGFIVPGENANLGTFSENGSARFTFDIDNTGDHIAEKFIRVTFGPKTSPAVAQTATIELPDGRTFTAPTTVSSATAATAPAPAITTDAVSGVTFFAGIADDPFFFDIPAFGRFVASVRAGAADATVFTRGRDSFAGYNVLSIALSMPVSFVKGAGNEIGMSNTAQRRIVQFIGADGEVTGSGRYVNADRQGLPGINTVLVPFGRKKEYNHANPGRDVAGDFANDIVATLVSLGTNQTNINALAGLAVTRGDILRLDVTKPNAGTGGGSGANGFPNGRRLGDDVIDTILTIVANGATLGDSVPANDVPFRDTFPFLAPPHAPRPAGTIDDSTRN